MEGYLIRVPVEACIQESRPAWRQISEARGPVYSRVLYYIVEEGFLRGYQSPHDIKPVESFQLTSHRIEVNAMNSLNIFEIKARVVKVPPTQQLVEDTSSSSSDSSDEDDDYTATRVEPTRLYRPQVTLAPSAQSLSGTYHVVFFAPNKELVKIWSVKLLNWNRYVFSSCHGPDEEELNLFKAEIIEALRVVNTADSFLRPVHLRTVEIASDNAVNASPSAQVSVSSAPVDTLNVASSPMNTLTPTETFKSDVESVEVVKPSTTSSQPSNPWWVVPLGRSKRISAYTTRR